MKKSNLTLFLVFLAILSFLIFLAFRNEKKYTPVPEEKLNIKEIPIPMVPEELKHTPIAAKG